ncbi:MAG: efflux transporter outer membrane subunit [Planctomycetes bacterium]|nr:efflux transporter outer membrane subunit [Planctomycetota bacterium]
MSAPSLLPAPRRTFSRSALLLAFVASCTVGPDYEQPQLELPTSWSAERGEGLIDGELAGTAADAAWWQQFGDPLLDELVERALQQNLDLRQSLARLAGARAQSGVADAGYLPTLDGNANYANSKASRNTPFGAFIPRTDIHTISFDAAWELDLWGRVRRSVEAADADLMASGYDLHAAALSVAAEVARTYVDLRAAQRRLSIANENLALQLQTLDLVKARLTAGLVVERDVAQAATNVETTRSRLPQLEAAAVTAWNRLAVLLGGTPDQLPATLREPMQLPQLPERVAIGGPADLLRRRPDVQRAERQFAAEVARIGVASADRYPSFRLSGQIGISSNGANKLFDRDSDLLNFGPSLRWNLFDGGRLKHRIEALEANAEAAQVAYEQTVLLAIEETENAITRFGRERTRREALVRAASEARRAVDLAQTQYREGLSDFQAVLDSERIAATIDDDLASSDAAVATNLIALYKALGGGVPSGQ